MGWERFTHREHILKRPDTYVGPIENVMNKIFQEIIVNASDEYMRDKKANTIEVSVCPETKKVSITNNKCIPVIKQDDCWLIELIFGHLLTSSNFDDDQARYTGGRNGYGAKLTNIFSKVFTVTSGDPEYGSLYSQTWRDNMSVCEKPIIKKYKKKTGFFTVSFEPDMTKVPIFSFDTLRDITVDTGLWVPKVTFNGEIVSSSFSDFMKTQIGSSPFAKMTEDGWEIFVAKSEDGFKHFSYVNGIKTYRGGTHVDYVVSEIAKILKCRTTQLRPHLLIGIKLLIDKPVFSSQTKNELENVLGPNQFTCKPKFAKDVSACGFDSVIEDKKLKKTDGSKKSRISDIPDLDDAIWAGTSKSDACTLFLTEGLSAKALVISGLTIVGRNAYGVFPLRGKPKNVRDAAIKNLETNKEFMNLKKILGLKQNEVYENTKKLRYGRIMIMTDADLDGSHIKGLILNIFHVFWPSLLQLGFVCSMVTPVIKRGSEWFYTEEAFKQAPPRNISTKYYKGLGTSTAAEAKEYFRNIDKLTVKFLWDDDTNQTMNLAFSKTQSSDRKTWLLDYAAGSSTFINYGHISTISISEFINVDLIKFSTEDIFRSIPHLADGLKPSQRGVIYAGKRKGNLESDINVGQFCGYIGEHTDYHHGEASLQGTVIGLAQNFVGSGNNMNLLVPIGQFGTSLEGGSDHASVRYINTKFSPWTKILFDSRDDEILEKGKPVPKFYIPILPMCLINGAEGIGTGFSCKIPSFNPVDVKNNILRILNKEQMKKMNPWFRGFSGKITKLTDTSWVAEGLVEKIEESTYRISCLPPGVWTQKFKESLDAENVRYENHSTDEHSNFIVYSESEPPTPRKVFHTTNMCLNTPTGIVKFESAEQILFEFSRLRLKFYKLRKENLIKNISNTLVTLETKMKFIRCVIDGEISVMARPITEISENMKTRSFPMDLLKTRLDEYTEDNIQKLHNEIEESRRVLDEIKNTSVADMWRKDLLALY
jgi:DNA topoisomerase-2